MGQVGRRRRRWPFVLLALLLLVVAILVGADFAVRFATEDAIATDVHRSTHSQSASASIDSFPFLYDTIARGRVDRLEVTDRGVPAGPFRIDQIQVVASQVRFSRSQLLSDHKVDITAVARATFKVTARLTTLENSIATTLGARITATASNQLVVSVAGRTVATIDLTRIPIVPLCPLNLAHTGDTYVLSCTVAPVPAPVLAALSKARSS